MTSKTKAKTTRARKPKTATRKKRAKKPEAPADTVSDTVSDSQPEADPQPAPTTESEDTDPWDGLDAPAPSEPDLPDTPLPTGHAASPTLASACSDWLAHLEALGKTPATVKSYAGDLALARRFLGEMTPLGDVTRDLSPPSGPAISSPRRARGGRRRSRASTRRGGCCGS